jgi:hypothetical protein
MARQQSLTRDDSFFADTVYADYFAAERMSARGDIVAYDESTLQFACRIKA